MPTNTTERSSWRNMFKHKLHAVPDKTPAEPLRFIQHADPNTYRVTTLKTLKSDAAKAKQTADPASSSTTSNTGNTKQTHIPAKPQASTSRPDGYTVGRSKFSNTSYGPVYAGRLETGYYDNMGRRHGAGPNPYNWGPSGDRHVKTSFGRAWKQDEKNEDDYTSWGPGWGGGGNVSNFF